VRAAASPPPSRLPVSEAAGQAARNAVLLDAYLGALQRMGRIRWTRTARAHLEDLFRRVDFAGLRMLDIGCGDGFYSFYAALKGAREVVCLEPEAAGCERGVTCEFERVREALPDLPIRLEPLRVERYRDAEGFDFILMNASINHIDEDACVRLREDAAARETFRRVFAHIGALARPGARLMVVDCSRRNFFAALGVTNPFCPTIEWHKHQAPRLWAGLLAEAGFRNPRIRWEPLYRFGRAAQPLFSNPAAAFFLKSMFRLEMEKA
jgi:SAM-dependent methyltransferase